MHRFGKFEGLNGLELDFDQGLFYARLSFSVLFLGYCVYKKFQSSLVFFLRNSITLSNLGGFAKFKCLFRLELNFSQGLFSAKLSNSIT